MQSLEIQEMLLLHESLETVLLFYYTNKQYLGSISGLFGLVTLKVPQAKPEADFLG